MPVFEGNSGQKAYLYGQAPGPVEGAELRPWRGRAGRALRAWLEMDEAGFYSTFYCASVTRCDPGRSPSGRGDRLPTATEQELCAAWREHELRLLRPLLIVTVGGLAARRLLGIRRLTDAIGESFELDGVTAIPLPHPVGSFGLAERCRESSPTSGGSRARARRAGYPSRTWYAPGGAPTQIILSPSSPGRIFRFEPASTKT